MTAQVASYLQAPADKPANRETPLFTLALEMNYWSGMLAEKFQRIPHPDGNSLMIQQGTRQWQFDLHQDPTAEGTVTIASWYGPVENPMQVGLVLDQVFAHTGAQCLRLSCQVLADTAALTMPHWQQDLTGASISRQAFYQLRENWLSPALNSVTPDIRVSREGIAAPVPVRPHIPDGVVYQRQIPALNEVFSLRKATLEEDGERFHRWQNEPRIAKYWEYPFSREKLDAYLQERRDDPHCEPLIASFDGQPFGYIETYWCLEDRLGPYYDARPFDHGFHVLVGETTFLGRGRSLHWVNAVSHFLFLLDPRTDRLAGEPRADNQKLLKLLDSTAWYKEREFDFPHKRAALVKCERESFFGTSLL